MKQFLRFFFSPATFVNQLQWSTNHGWILLALLGVAFVESQFGTGRALNLQISWLLSDYSGIPRDQSLFLVMSGRIAFMFFGALSLAETLWWVGMRLGRTTSKRVLQRRLAVVLTFLLTGYTLLAMPSETAQLAAYGVFGWSLVLSYLTLREQFFLGPVGSGLVGAMVAATILFSWQVSDRVIQTAAGYAIADQVAHSKAPQRSRRH